MALTNTLGSVESALGKIFGILDKTEAKMAAISSLGSKFGESISKVAAGAQAAGRGGGGGGGMMPTSLGNVPPIPEASGRVQANFGGAGGGAGGGGGGGLGAAAAATPYGRVAAVAAGVAGAAYNLTPGLPDSMALMGGLFPTSFAATGQYDRMATGRRIVQGIGDGASGALDPAMATTLAAARGFVYSPNDNTVDKMLKGAEFSYVMTGMSNPAAVSGLTDLYRGASGVNDRLLEYGINTIDAKGGTRDLGDIVNQILKRQMSGDMTEEDFNKSLAMGYIGQTFNYMFGDSPELYAQAVALARTQVKAGGKTLRMGDGSALEAARSMGLEDSPYLMQGKTQSSQFSANVEASEGLQMGGGFAQTMTTALYDIEAAIIRETGILGDILMAIKGGYQGTMAGIGKSAGGAVTGRSNSTHDNVHAILSSGEYVINARAASMIGRDQLDQMNALGQEFGAGFASPAPIFLSKGGLATLSGNPALKPGSSQLTTVAVAGGRRITVAKEAASAFQRLLSMWQSDPDLGGGRFDLSTGPLDSFNFRQARYSSGISDHAGWAIDVRYDILKADGRRHMTSKEDAAVRRILSALGGKIGWGGDYQSKVDEMHFFYKGGGAGGYEYSEGSNSSGHTDANGEDMLDSASLTSLAALINSSNPSGASGLRAAPFAMLQAFSMRGLSGSNGRMLSVSSSAPLMGSSSASSSGSSGVSSNAVNNILGSAVGFIKGTGTSLLDRIRQIFGAGKEGESESGSDYTPVAGALGNEELLRMLQNAGFTGERLREAWAIVMRESNGRPSAHNPDRSTGDNSYGLFQINMLGSLGPERLKKFARFGVSKNEDLFDPWKNIQAAAYMSQKGNNWSSWVSPQYGRASEFYRQFPQVAKKAGIPGYAHGAEYISKDQVANLHQGELVMPAAQAQMFREVLQETLSGARGKAQDINITLHIDKASDEEAERFAKKVISIVKNNERRERMATL